MSFLIKMLFKEFLFSQYVGPDWVKNGKKGCCHHSHLTTNQVFPKNSP